MTPAQRSKLMSCIRSKDTKIEKQIRSLLHRSGFRFRKHVTTLPGKPDIVFPRHRVVVFLDGDFWHGYRCHTWLPKLAPYWRLKIARNRTRDRNNFQRLRRQGWKVIRLWEHQIKRDADGCVCRIIKHLR
jgi:DNA mismatch endonuclease (patch repair protein)